MDETALWYTVCAQQMSATHCYFHCCSNEVPDAGVLTKTVTADRGRSISSEVF